jgi:4-amino-4-deoxy-L-arabinose transferase-like glycosyltransferase
MTIAAVDILGSAELLGAARIVSILSFVILVITIFPLGLHLQGKITAHLSAFSVVSLATLIYLYCFCWSETVYTMFSVLFFLLLVLFLKAPQGSNTKYLILSGVFAGLATITRYVGYSLIATGILSILFLSNYHSISKRIKKTLSFALMAGISVFLHYLSHFYYWALTSKSHYASPHSFTHQLLLFFSTIYHDLLSSDLSFWRYAFLFEWGSSFSWVRLITIICMLFLSVLFFKAVLFSKRDKGSLRLQIPMVFYLVLYSSIVLYTSSTIAIDPIGSRFTVSLYPFLLFLVFSGISHGYKSFAPRKTKMLFIGLALLGIASFWAIQITSTMNIYKGISSGSFPAMEQPGNLNRESIKFIKKTQIRTIL